MNAQPDLFESAPEIEVVAPREAITVAEIGEPIAIPCGFTDRTKSRCRRLATRPVLVDGEQLASRGRPMFYCDPACYRATGLDDTRLETKG